MSKERELHVHCSVAGARMKIDGPTVVWITPRGRWESRLDDGTVMSTGPWRCREGFYCIVTEEAQIAPICRAEAGKMPALTPSKRWRKPEDVTVHENHDFGFCPVGRCVLPIETGEEASGEKAAQEPND